VPDCSALTQGRPGISQRDLNPHGRGQGIPIEGGDESQNPLGRKLILCPRGDLYVSHNSEALPLTCLVRRDAQTLRHVSRTGLVVAARGTRSSVACDCGKCLASSDAAPRDAAC
jgi:hypothetical protein